MFKVLTFLLSLGPLAYSVFQVYLLQTGSAHALGADPGKALVLMQGEWTIRFLVLTLLITPLRRLTGWNRPQKIRRMLGLFTFFYASLHLLAYMVWLLELDFANLWSDIIKRPYVTVGFSAYLLLIPLVITSTNGMMRRLGHRWLKLHRAIYAVAALAVTHLLWLSKSSYAEAAFYGALIGLLLLARVFGSKLRLFRGAASTGP